MAFELPFPPFPHDSRDVPFIATPDDNNGYAVPSSQYFKKLVGEKYLWTPVSSTDPLPSSDAAAQAKLADILTKLSADPATQTTLAQILAKIIDAPATEAKQTALNALVGEVQAAPTPNTLLARLKNLETKVDAIIADGLKLSGSNITDTQAIPTKPVTKLVMLANAEAFTATISKTYDIVTVAGLSYEDIRKYRRFRFTFYNTHDKVASVSLGASLPARAENFYGNAAALYKEDNNLAVNNYLIIQGQVGGTGIMSTMHKIVPALTDGIYSNLYIQIKFNEAPTTGALSIACEMGV
jgi:hypothetical protein